MRYYYLEEYFANGDIIAERVPHDRFPHGIRFHSIHDTGPYGYTVSVDFKNGEYIATTAGCARGIKDIEAKGASIDDALTTYLSLWKQ